MRAEYFPLLKVHSNYKTNELLVLKYPSNYKILLAIICIWRVHLE